MFIVNTCWVYVTDSDGVSTLKNVEFAELEKIKAENRAAPKGKRRYFIEDYCVNGSVCECLHLEVTREQYNLWQREYRANAGALNAESDAVKHLTKFVYIFPRSRIWLCSHPMNRIRWRIL